MNKFYYIIIISITLIYYLGNAVTANPLPDTSSHPDSQLNNAGNTIVIWNKTETDSFIKRAAEGNLLKAQLGDTASHKGILYDVRNFGNLMVEDNCYAFKELKAATQNIDIKIPTTPGKLYIIQIDSLSKLKSNKFDKAYMALMVKLHKQDMTDFEIAEKHLPAGPLKTWVTNALPIIQKNLQIAEPISASLNKSLP